MDDLTRRLRAGDGAGADSLIALHALAPDSSDVQMRLDAAGILKRFHYLDRALVLACSGWIPAVHGIETKALLARTAWQCSLTADALRTRVFELKYPSRILSIGDDQPVVTAFEAAQHAPSGPALLDALARVYLPALAKAHELYLIASDELADGPSRRFLELSVREKRARAEELLTAVSEERAAHAEYSQDQANTDAAWVSNVSEQLATVGGLDLRPPIRIAVAAVLAQGAPFSIPVDPGRDHRYFPCAFYWPDTIDPTYGYGSGRQLQVRVAVSHLNEVWAVETAGLALYELADELGWEFVRDASRWTYDESRHMLMGQRRLASWGLDPANVPLGRYIFDAARTGGDPIHRIGMLGFFETKNIGKKRDRARAFSEMGDFESERDMEFDWADETIHAEYGRRWLKQLLKQRGRPTSAWPEVLAECERLVAARKTLATPVEIAAIHECARRLLASAEQHTARQQ